MVAGPNVFPPRVRVLARAAGDTSDAAQGAVIDVEATPSAPPSPAQELLGGVSFLSASSGESVPALSLWDNSSSSSVALLCFLTHFGDLTTAEYAQLIQRKIMPEVAGSVKITVAAIGLGSVENARAFASLVGFPLDFLFCDPEGEAYAKLGFSTGFAADAPVSPYLKLLPMLAGIGSPGTMQEVLRGYTGDRQRSPIFEASTPFDVLGTGYQRPFELATQRLFNMGTVLSNWSQLAPAQENLLTQQGGTIIFKGGQDVFFHRDSGILMYANVDQVVSILREELE